MFFRCERQRKKRRERKVREHERVKGRKAEVKGKETERRSGRKGKRDR